MIGFLFYFFDVALVFKDDFLYQNVSLHFESFWDIGNLYPSVVTGAGCMLFFWLAICDYIDERRKPFRYGPAILFVVLSLAVPFFEQEPRWHEFSFYTMRETTIFIMFAYLAIHYATCKSEVERIHMRSHRTAYCFAIIFTIGILLENIYFQLIFDPAIFEEYNVWFFAERNFFENMLMVCVAVVTLQACAKTLVLRFDKPPAREDAALEQSIGELLPLYCKRHDLSEREGEVLELVLRGKDNQNIASSMNLALNTVKVHMHNILKKTHKSNRQELIRSFWQG
jgi:DNA-binding CsgD family transcriptional regulator